ncbi:MAG: RNA polymerase sigma factor RpoD/SigA [Fimbriimonadales bacterium]|nr:RNA polymerase sigma factor RpoD/SigA [Fimbriimonadales bacterium]
MDEQFGSEAMFSLVEKGRLQGYITIEELLQSLPEELEPEAVEETLSLLEAQGVQVLSDGEVAELELRKLAEEADREIEAIENEAIDDAVRWWIQQAARVPRLTPEQEQEIARRVQEGDESARERLIQSNLRLVIAIARHYTGRGLPLADLIQEGNLGLIKAASMFRPEKGTRFATYASWWIRHQIGRALQEQASMVRLPAHLMKALRQVRQTTAMLQQELGRRPTLHEVAHRTGMSPEQVTNLLNTIARPLSLETPVGESEETTMLDLLVEEPPPEIGVEIDMERLLSVLNEKERQVIQLRYGLGDAVPLTLEETGRAMNLSRERVRQLEARALEKLRKAMGA